MSLSLSANKSIHLQASLQTAWGYFQHEMLYVTWGLMDVALLTPFSLAIMKWARYWPSAQVTLWLLLIMLLPFNLARLMSLMNLPKTRQQTVMALALLLTLLATMRTFLYPPESLFDFSWLTRFYANLAQDDSLFWSRDLSVFFLTIFMWWRGIRLVNQGLNVERAGLRLRMGSLLIAPLVVWVGNSLAWDVTSFILLFFLASLTSIALIRAEQIEQAKSGHSASLNPRWLTAVFIASLLTVLTSGALAAIISGESLIILIAWLAPLWAALHFGAAAIANTILYIAQPLLTLFAILIDWLSALLTKLFATYFTDVTIPTRTLAEIIPTSEAAEEVVETIDVGFQSGKIITTLLMIAAVLVISLALGRLYRLAALADRDADSSIINDPLAAPKKASLGQRIWQQLGFLRNWRAAASVRRIYQQMCKAATASGFPRADSETPYEYTDTLAEVWPENRADSWLITQAFVKIRYGELPETTAELDQIIAAWDRLKRIQPTQIDTPQVEQRL